MQLLLTVLSIEIKIGDLRVEGPKFQKNLSIIKILTFPRAINFCFEKLGVAVYARKLPTTRLFD